MIIDKYSIFIFLAISIYLYIAYKNSNIGLSYYDHNLSNSSLNGDKDEILVEVLNQFNIKPSNNLKDTDFLLTAPEQNEDINNVKGFGTSSFNKTIFSHINEKNVTQKYKFWKALVKEHGRDKASNIMPEVYLTNNTADMKEFFEEAHNTTNIGINNHLYLLKSEREGTNGIYISNNDFSDISRQLFNHNKFYNRTFSNSFEKLDDLNNNRYTMIQKYIPNPLVIKKRVFKISLPIIIAKCYGAVKGFVNKNGVVYWSRDKFDIERPSMQNIIASKEQMNKNRTQIDVDNLYSKYPRTFIDLKKYCDENDVGINSTQLSSIITKYCKMAIHTAHKQIGNDKIVENNVSMDMYNIDIIIDSDFKPWIIKFKKAKTIKNPTPLEKNIRKKCWKDSLKLFNYVKTSKKNSFKLIWEEN